MNNEHTAPGKASKPRHRSPNYPAIGLRESVDRVRKLYEADKRAGSPIESAVKHLGFSSAHGGAMVVVSALRKFGLLEDSAGRVVPSNLAISILVYPESDQRRKEALRDAALKPDVYRKLYDRYAEAGQIPSDETLKAELEADMGFNPTAVSGFVKDFKDSLIYAGLLDPDELTLAIEVEKPMGNLANQPSLHQPQGRQGRDLLDLHDAGAATRPLKSYAWALSPTATAELRISGEVATEDLEMLRDYVEITIKALARTAKKDGTPQ